MKTSFIYAYNIFKVTAISTLFLITWLFQFQNVYGAGSPKVSTPSPQELRQKANIQSGRRIEPDIRSPGSCSHTITMIGV